MKNKEISKDSLYVQSLVKDRTKLLKENVKLLIRIEALENKFSLQGVVKSFYCNRCKLPFTKEEIEVNEHCYNCGEEMQ